MMVRDAAISWMAAAFAVAAALALAVLVPLGAGPVATRLALRVTARWSFALFWLAYCAGPLATLFGVRFQPLARRTRSFGLGFAAAHLVHVALVGWLWWLAGHAPLPPGLLAFFSLGLVCTYGLALLSIPRWQRALDPMLWRVLALVALNYIWLNFAADFVRAPLLAARPYPLGYLPFTLLTVAAPLLRIAALARRVLTTARPRSTEPLP
jgi:hypothetical protein